MKIMVDILKVFITKLSIGDEIKDCILDFNEDGLNVVAKNEKSIAVNGKLKNVSFTDYKPIGKIGIRDNGRLIKYLDILKGEIKIKIKDNKLILNDDLIFWDYGLCDEEFIKSKLKKYPDYEITVMQKLEGEKINMIKKLVNSVKTDEIKIMSTENETVFNVNAEQDSGKMTVPFSFGNDMTVVMGESFIKVIGILGQKVEICFKNNAPMLIKDKSEFMDFEYLVSNKSVN